MRGKQRSIYDDINRMHDTRAFRSSLFIAKMLSPIIFIDMSWRSKRRTLITARRRICSLDGLSVCAEVPQRKDAVGSMTSGGALVLDSAIIQRFSLMEARVIEETVEAFMVVLQGLTQGRSTCW
jgi:hypothetical protein